MCHGSVFKHHQTLGDLWLSDLTGFVGICRGLNTGGGVGLGHVSERIDENDVWRLICGVETLSPLP